MGICGSRPHRVREVIGSLCGIVGSPTPGLGTSRRGRKMAQYEFLGDYPSDRELDWTDSLQGVTHNRDHWIFTQLTRILKIHVSRDLNNTRLSDASFLLNGMPSELAALRCNHFGDSDYVLYRGKGYLFVPVEGTSTLTDSMKGRSTCGSDPRLAVFEDDGSAGPLQLLDHKPLASQNRRLGTARAGWCAFSPDRLLYSSSNSIGANKPIFRYRVDFDALAANGELNLTPESDLEPVSDDGTTLLEIPGYVQGGVFDPDGRLYIVNGRMRNAQETLRSSASRIIGFRAGSWRARHGGIRVIRPDGTLEQKSTTDGNNTPGGRFQYAYKPGDTEEPEGITYWNLSPIAQKHDRVEGQLHAILLNKQVGDDNLWLKHYSMSPPASGSDPKDFTVFTVPPLTGPPRDPASTPGLSLPETGQAAPIPETGQRAPMRGILGRLRQRAASRQRPTGPPSE